jgi:ABC-type maltose transport system permease subunit
MKFIIYVIIVTIINFFIFHPYIHAINLKNALVMIYASGSSAFLLFTIFDDILRLLNE